MAMAVSLAACEGSMDRFHCEAIGDAGGRVTLTPEETRHMVAVRRVAVCC